LQICPFVVADSQVDSHHLILERFTQFTMKRIFPYITLVLIIVLVSSFITAAAPLPVTTFMLVRGLPLTMNVGDTSTVVIEVESNVPFIFAQALPAMQFPGRGVVGAVGDHVGQGTTATLEVTFTAKESTSDFPNSPGYSPVSVTVGVRYPGGYVVAQRYDFVVTVP